MKYIEDDVIKILEFMIGNICVVFEGTVFGKSLEFHL